MSLLIRFDDILALFPGAELRGEARPDIHGVQSMEDAGEGEATFASGVKAAAQLEGCNASLVFVTKTVTRSPKDGQLYMVVENPALAVSKVAELIEKLLRPDFAPGIHPSAVIEKGASVDPSASVGALACVGEGARVGARTVIEAGVKLGRGAVVGEDCHLFQNVVVADLCRVGNRVRIHPCTVIGADGFGYLQVGKLPDVVHYKIPQVGIVVIDDNVEIGANTTIDRARFGQTRVGEGTKIDNLVQVGHNCIIGRRCIICSMVGLSGSTTIGDYVVMWGQSATVGHISIGDFAFVGGQAGVTKDLPKGAKVTGTPARSLFEVRKSDAAMAQLPALFPKLKQLLGETDSPSSDNPGTPSE
jgi:UDP-3-O-[3-hydroxymyristoyl] glucosamine N-acyltransferase